MVINTPRTTLTFNTTLEVSPRIQPVYISLTVVIDEATVVKIFSNLNENGKLELHEDLAI